MTTNKTTMKMIVVKARIAGGIGPFLILAWTKVDKVSMVFSPLSKPAPLVKAVTMKSSSDKVMAKRKPERIPGRISGKMTLKRACLWVQPRSRAASYKAGSICWSFGLTER